MSTAPVPDAGPDLARWVASGDREALDRALAAAAGPAFQHAFRLLGRSTDADDATQEALVQLVRWASRYDATKPFRPWLAKLVHDACCRLLRSNRRRRRYEAEVTMPTPSEMLVDSEAVRAAVLELPESLRAVVELHYLGGLSQSETAAALGLGESACAMRLSRARERLRRLLARRGVTAAAAVALTALAATPAQAASPTIAAQVAAQAAAGTLPSTTIPLTPLQSGVWFMSSHPIASSLIAAGIVLAAAAPFAVTAGEAPAPKPQPLPPVVRNEVDLSAQATALLPFLDPTASYRAMVDVATLRPQLLKVKPFSILADPKMAAILPRLRAMKAMATGRGASPAMRRMVEIAEDSQAFLLVMQDRSRGGRAIARMVQFDLGPSTAAVAKDVAAAKGAGRPATIGGYQGDESVYDGQAMFEGSDQQRFVVATSAWLATRIAAAPAPAPPAHAWFTYNAGPLISRYAELSGPTEDPANVGMVLGERWRSFKPVVEGTIRVDGTDLIGATRVSGAAPFSPLVPLILMAGGNIMVPFSQFAPCPIRQPRIGIPPSADRVLAFSVGLTLPPQADRFTKVTTDWSILRTRNQELDLLSALLVRVWSGDLAGELKPGAPLPKAALSFGLRTGVDPVEVVRQVAMFLAADQGPLDQPGPLPKSVSVLLPGMAGQLSFTAFADRVVVTWNAEADEWPGIAAGTSAKDAADFAIEVDLPKAARTWGGLALMTVPDEQLPPLPVLIAHLPVWRMSWQATPDGIVINERGLPAATLFMAVAMGMAVDQPDPELEIERVKPAVPVKPAATEF